MSHNKTLQQTRQPVTPPLVLNGPLLEQRRHGCGAAGRYEMSPIDAEADIDQLLNAIPNH